MLFNKLLVKAGGSSTQTQAEKEGGWVMAIFEKKFIIFKIVQELFSNYRGRSFALATALPSLNKYGLYQNYVSKL